MKMSFPAIVAELNDEKKISTRSDGSITVISILLFLLTTHAYKNKRTMVVYSSFVIRFI
jgi:hypothetical protein